MCPLTRSLASSARRRDLTRLLLVGSGLCLPLVAQAAPPAGHTRSIHVPRVVGAPRIDGVLDDTAWGYATPTTDFWISEYGRAPQDQTEVRVVADANALYFAFVCRDPAPNRIHAEQTKRDSRLSGDDHVTVALDPYHNHRQVSEFSVNPIGTQSDAIAGGRARKIEWKGDWQAAARRTSTGWTAEIAIPFGILNYQPGSNTFGVNFERFQHRTQERSRWADVTPEFREEEMGHLTGLALPRTPSRARFSALQYLTMGVNGLDKLGNFRRSVADGGWDLRYDAASNLAAVLSINPDFSQVEEDVLDLSFDYNEKFLTDRRPFFQEGSAFFGDETYFHSGRVPNFDAGLKSFGKIGAFQYGLLDVHSPGARRDQVARILREIGPTTHSALTYVGTARNGVTNRLLDFETTGRTKRGLRFGLDLARSFTQGLPGDGTRSRLTLGLDRRYWYVRARADRTDDRFLAANGTLKQDLLGTRGVSGALGYSRQFAAGPLRGVEGTVSYDARETLTNLLQRRELYAGISAETRSNIALSFFLTTGPYRPRDRKTGDWSRRVNYDRLYSVSAFFDTRSDRRGYGLTYSWGHLGGGRYSDLSPSFWWKPNSRTYLSYSYQEVESFGRQTQNVLSASWDITPEQSLSARWVGGGGDFWRLAYRRQVRRGIDAFVVYRHEPDVKGRFTVKLVWTL